jgi:hypothetical protein
VSLTEFGSAPTATNEMDSGIIKNIKTQSRQYFPVVLCITLSCFELDKGTNIPEMRRFVHHFSNPCSPGLSFAYYSKSGIPTQEESPLG